MVAVAEHVRMRPVCCLLSHRVRMRTRCDALFTRVPAARSRRAVPAVNALYALFTRVSTARRRHAVPAVGRGQRWSRVVRGPRVRAGRRQRST